MSKIQKGVRAYCFTVNNYTDEDEVQLDSLECKYMIYGHEICPTTGTPHLQGYVYLSFQRTMSALSKDVHRASWREAKGNPDQNQVYCSKEATNVKERGVKPMSQKRKGECNAERWDEAKKAAKEGRLDDLPSDIYFKFYRTAKEIAKDNMVKPPALDSIDNWWYYGKSGTGKSRTAFADNPDAYLKMCNKWWDGYQGQEVVLIDDFDKAHEGLCHHLKVWCHHNPFIAETKGGGIQIRPKRFIVTSNYHPADIWKEDASLEPILRRFQLKEFK